MKFCSGAFVLSTLKPRSAFFFCCLIAALLLTGESSVAADYNTIKQFDYIPDPEPNADGKRPRQRPDRHWILQDINLFNKSMRLFRKHFLTNGKSSQVNSVLARDDCNCRAGIFSAEMLKVSSFSRNNSRFADVTERPLKVKGFISVLLSGDVATGNNDWGYHIAPVFKYYDKWFIAETLDGYFEASSWLAQFNFPDDAVIGFRFQALGEEPGGDGSTDRSNYPFSTIDEAIVAAEAAPVVEKDYYFNNKKFVENVRVDLATLQAVRDNINEGIAIPGKIDLETPGVVSALMQRLKTDNPAAWLWLASIYQECAK